MEVNGGYSTMIPKTGEFKNKIEGLAVETNDLGDSLADVADKGGRALTDLATEGTKATDKLVRGAQKAGGAYSKLGTDLLADAQKIVTNYYDVLILKDDLAATNAEINALRKIAASRKLTAEETANLHRLQATQAQLVTDLAEHGATQSGAFKDAMTDLLARLKKAHGAERRAILAEIEALKLLALQASFTSSKIAGMGGLVSPINWSNPPGKAAGGPVNAGQPYWVGERGPELFVPSPSSGTIIPNAPSMAMAGASGGDTYNVNLLDRMEVRSVRDIGAGLRMLGETGNLGRRKR